MRSIQDLETELSRRERLLERRIGEARSLASEGVRVQEEQAQAQQWAQAHEEAVGLLNSFADAKQEEAIRRIETLVSAGLRSIFGESMSFAVKSDLKARRAEIEFVIRSEVDSSIVETPVLDARGGGVAAVVGFLLRVIILLLKPGLRRILFLDESFAQLSAEYEEPCAEFLRELADKAGVQIILVTHSEAYSPFADRVYKTSQIDGWTQVELKGAVNGKAVE